MYTSICFTTVNAIHNSGRSLSIINIQNLSNDLSKCECKVLGGLNFELISVSYRVIINLKYVILQVLPIYSIKHYRLTLCSVHIFSVFFTVNYLKLTKLNMRKVPNNQNLTRQT